MGTILSFFLLVARPPLSDILLLNPAVLGRGAQSVIVNRNTRRSDDIKKYKGVQQ